MATQGHSPEQWARLVAELRAEDQRRREVWGDVDDETLALYLSGDCTPEEKQRVESAMAQFPAVREALELARSAPDLEPGDLVGRDQQPPAQVGSVPLPSVARRFGPVALAAGLLVAALGLYWFGRSAFSTSGEVLVAQVEVQYRDVRGGGPGDFRIVIQSPRDGVATIVRVTPTRRDVWPRPGEAPISLRAAAPAPYGPFDAAEGPAVFWVVVTEQSAADTLRTLLAAESTSPGDVGRFSKQIEEALWQAGHRWAAIQHVMVEPPAQQGPKQQ